MGFRGLHQSLVRHLRDRVRNGEISERSLARLAGISQPHIHNVLKGVRFLSPEMADQILTRMQLDVATLLTSAEPVTVSHKHSGAGRHRLVPVLHGRIGPGHPFPLAGRGIETYPFAESELTGLERPAAARLASDPDLGEPFRNGALVLLDLGERIRGMPDEKSYYALDLGHQSAIALVRWVGRHLSIVDGGPNSDGVRPVPVPGGDLLARIRGRVSLVVRKI